MKKPFILISVAVILLAIFLPVYLMIRISFSPPQDILNLDAPLLMRSATFDHWREVLSSGQVLAPLRKSLSVALFSVVLGLLLSLPAAYTLSRLPYAVTTPILMLIFVSRMIPEVNIALPVSITFIRWGLLDTDLGLVLAHTLRILPIMTWILISGFKLIPKELEEACWVDGCGKLKGIIRIILPLALPSIGVAAIFGFLSSWDEFTYALYLCFSNKTLPLTVYYYVQRGSFFSSAAYSLIITIPVVIATYVLQRHMKAEYLAGISQK